MFKEVTVPKHTVTGQVLILTCDHLLCPSFAAWRSVSEVNSASSFASGEVR